jgi:hypothetical protein
MVSGNGKRFGGEFLFRADGVAHEVGVIGRVIVQTVIVVVEVVVCGSVVRIFESVFVTLIFVDDPKWSVPKSNNRSSC